MQGHGKNMLKNLEYKKKVVTLHPKSRNEL